MFGCQLCFEEQSVVMSRETWKIYQLFQFERMYIFDIAISTVFRHILSSIMVHSYVLIDLDIFEMSTYY